MRLPLKLIIFTLFFSCKRENTDVGFYIKKDYLEYNDSISQKSFELNQSQILFKITSDTLFHWGDIKYWGEYEIKQPFPFRKIKHKGKIKYLLDILSNGNTETFEYIKIANGEKFIDSLGLNFEEIEDVKAENFLAGKYFFDKNEVVFHKDGKISGLNEIKKYQIYLRAGTNFPFLGLNFIDTDNGVWKFSLKGNYLILTQFKKERNKETEKYELSDKKIILLKP